MLIKDQKISSFIMISKLHSGSYKASSLKMILTSDVISMMIMFIRALTSVKFVLFFVSFSLISQC